MIRITISFIAILTISDVSMAEVYGFKEDQIITQDDINSLPESIRNRAQAEYEEVQARLKRDKSTGDPYHIADVDINAEPDIFTLELDPVLTKNFSSAVRDSILVSIKSRIDKIGIAKNLSERDFRSAFRRAVKIMKNSESFEILKEYSGIDGEFENALVDILLNEDNLSGFPEPYNTIIAHDLILYLLANRNTRESVEILIALYHCSAAYIQIVDRRQSSGLPNAKPFVPENRQFEVANFKNYLISVWGRSSSPGFIPILKEIQSRNGDFSEVAKTALVGVELNVIAQAQKKELAESRKQANNL